MILLLYSFYSTIVISTAIVLLLFSIIFLLFLIFKKKQASHSNQLVEIKVKYENVLLQTQLEIQEQTLNTISQEIHDNIGQVLSLAKLNLNSFPLLENEQAMNKVKDTRELVGKAIRDLRDLTRSMHGDRIAEVGLMEATSDELKILENSGLYKTQLKITGQSCRLNAQKETVLFRIVQEALHNCVKHAGAKNITVQLDYAANSFTLAIQDDGAGFDLDTMNASQKGIGLKSMHNRAALIGASLTVQSAVGAGTTITATLATHH